MLEIFKIFLIYYFFVCHMAFFPLIYCLSKISKQIDQAYYPHKQAKIQEKKPQNMA